MADSDIEWTDRIAARFWSYVDKRGGDDCWEWTAGLFSSGYGQFRAGRRKVKAHRFAYTVVIGRIRRGLVICHRCDNRRCVNPSHLFAGTHADNAHDRESKGRGVALMGEQNPASKLTAKQVREIRRRVRAGEPHRALAADFDVHRNHVGRIARRERWG